MAFLVFKAAYSNAKSEYNQLAFEQIINSRALEKVTEQIGKLDDSKTSKSDADYRELVADQTTYDLRKDSIDTQMEVLKQDMESYKNALKNGIKESTSFWCFSK